MWVYVYAWTCCGHKRHDLCPWSELDTKLSGFGQAASWGRPNKILSLTWHVQNPPEETPAMAFVNSIADAKGKSVQE